MYSTPQIISISRRTDIPAYYSTWLRKRFADEFVKFINPFSRRFYDVSLAPEGVASIVFWSRNYKPSYRLITDLKSRGYPMIFHLTLTNLPGPFEVAVPDLDESLNQFKILSEQFSPAHVIWRYDPIVISSQTGYRWHVKNFSKISNALKPYTRRCYFSFVQIYDKTLLNLNRTLPEHKIKFIDPPIDEKIALARELAEISDSLDISFRACCQPELVQNGFLKASCVDAKLIEELYPEREIPTKSNPLRKGCGCNDSRDIGAYETCPSGCIYCYATSSQKKAEHFRRGFKSSKEFLG